ncbi:hypothetical protein ACQEVF_25095 [Nonomuraea polychroma]|uniref:hypothetical protein n=1 Tax=Nonomuraea polychroma TaxID=46176 RepID=UPI003D8C7AFC
MTSSKPRPITIRPAESPMLDTAVEISIRISNSELSGHTDAYLAMLWHAIQAAPADFEHSEVGRVAEHIGREIIRRWLREVKPEMWSQQGSHVPHHNLCRFAKWNGREWVMKDEAFQAELARRTETGDGEPSP